MKIVAIEIPVSHGGENPQLEADTLKALLVSVKSIGKDYDLSADDFDYIAEQRKKIDLIIADVKHHLSTKKKTSQYAEKTYK